MTTLGVLQILVYFLLILLTDQADRRIHGAGLQRGANVSASFTPARRAYLLQSGGVKEDSEQRWTQYCGAVLAFSFFSFLFVYLLQRLQGILPFNPMGFGTGGAPKRHGYDSGPRFQHGCQLHDQYELAIIRWRDDDELPGADGCAGGTELRLRRCRYRDCHRADSRFRPAKSEHHRELLGGSHRCTVYVLLPISLLGALFLVWQGMPQNFDAYTKSQPWKAQNRPSLRDRWLRRRRSRNLAPTAVDF